MKCSPQSFGKTSWPHSPQKLHLDPLFPADICPGIKDQPQLDAPLRIKSC